VTWYGDNPGLIAQRMKDICTRLLVIEEAEREYEWLSAQPDNELLDVSAGGTMNGGFTVEQLSLARGTFADLHALWQIVHNMQPAASYQITGTYDFMNNVRFILGGQG
jgi:hypothetical protein